MDNVFTKSYKKQDEEEEDEFLMEVNVYSKQSILSPGYVIDTLIAEIEDTDGPWDCVVTGDVTDVDPKDVEKACDALWVIVCNKADATNSCEFLEPIETLLKGPGQYQKNTLGWRVLSE